MLVSILNMFDVKLDAAFYIFMYEPSVIIQFGSMYTVNPERGKKAGSAQDMHA